MQPTPPPAAVKTTRISGPQLVALAATIWGSWSLYLRPAGQAGPLTAEASCLVVFIAASLFATPVAIASYNADIRAGRGPTWSRIDRRLWGVAAFAGLADAICSALFFAAMEMTTLAIANLTHYMAPVFVALAVPVLERSRLKGRVLGAVLLALFGMALLLQPWEGTHDARSWVGAGLGAASALFFAVQVMAGKRSAGGLSPFVNLAVQRAVSTVCLVPLAVTQLSALNLTQWAYLMAGGAVINGIAGMIFFAGLARCSADLAAGLTLLEPVSAVIIGWLVMHEPLSPVGVLGIALVLGSVWLCQREE